MQTISVYGEDIDFPDGMTDDQINSAIKTMISTGQIKDDSTVIEEAPVTPKEKFDLLKVVTELGKGIGKGALQNIKKSGADVATTEYVSQPFGGLAYFTKEESAKLSELKDKAQLEKEALKEADITNMPESKSGKIGYKVAQAVVPATKDEANIDALITMLTMGAAPGAATGAKGALEGIKAAKTAKKEGKLFLDAFEPKKFVPPGQEQNFIKIIKALSKKGFNTGVKAAKNALKYGAAGVAGGITMKQFDRDDD